MAWTHDCEIKTWDQIKIQMLQLTDPLRHPKVPQKVLYIRSNLFNKSPYFVICCFLLNFFIIKILLYNKSNFEKCVFISKPPGNPNNARTLKIQYNIKFVESYIHFFYYFMENVYQNIEPNTYSILGTTIWYFNSLKNYETRSKCKINFCPKL